MARLLIVDDDRHLLMLYNQVLSDLGYEVILAVNGARAQIAFQTGSPDLVILDIAMPSIDGIELLGKLLAKNKSVPVILNTAYPNYKSNFMTWCADAFVEKSGDLTELQDKIAEVLKSRGISVPESAENKSDERGTKETVN